jgi:hypothetical protein
LKHMETGNTRVLDVLGLTTLSFIAYRTIINDRHIETRKVASDECEWKD